MLYESFSLCFWTNSNQKVILKWLSKYVNNINRQGSPDQSVCLFYFKTHEMLLSVYTEKPKGPSGELALFMLQRLSPQFTLNVQKGPGPLVVSLNCMHKGTPDVLDVLRNLLVCLLCFVLRDRESQWST